MDVIKASPDADTTIIFTNRQQESKRHKATTPSQGKLSLSLSLSCSGFIAGEVVQALIGLSNKGKQYFVVTGVEASFRSVCVVVVSPVDICVSLFPSDILKISAISSKM